MIQKIQKNLPDQKNRSTFTNKCKLKRETKKPIKFHRILNNLETKFFLTLTRHKM